MWSSYNKYWEHDKATIRTHRTVHKLVDNDIEAIYQIIDAQCILDLDFHINVMDKDKVIYKVIQVDVPNDLRNAYGNSN